MNILMIDEDNNFCEDLSKYLKNNGDMTVINVTDNTFDAVKNMKDYNKILELVLLDLENINVNVDYILDNVPKNCNVIAFFETIETAKKHINNPYFQRIFQKPIAWPDVL
jgi:chemotaxis response regulator CheB